MPTKSVLPSGKWNGQAYAKVVKQIGKFTRQAAGKQGFARVYGIQDGLKLHWSPPPMAAARDSRVSFLPHYPARSPDLNPIENLFPHLDKYLASVQAAQGDAATKAAFLGRVRAFFALPSTRTLVLELADSMPRRLQKCIEMDGYATGY